MTMLLKVPTCDLGYAHHQCLYTAVCGCQYDWPWERFKQSTPDRPTAPLPRCLISHTCLGMHQRRLAHIVVASDNYRCVAPVT